MFKYLNRFVGKDVMRRMVINGSCFLQRRSSRWRAGHGGKARGDSTAREFGFCGSPNPGNVNIFGGFHGTGRSCAPLTAPLHRTPFFLSRPSTRLHSIVTIYVRYPEIHTLMDDYIPQSKTSSLDHVPRTGNDQKPLVAAASIRPMLRRDWCIPPATERRHGLNGVCTRARTGVLRGHPSPFGRPAARTCAVAEPTRRR